MIKLGVNSVLFRDFDFATAAKHIAWAGYNGIEVSAIKGMCEHLELERWQEQAADIKRIAAEADLELLSMEVASPDPERLRLAFAAAAGIGIPVVNIGPGGKTGVEGSLEEQTAKLADLAAMAESFGVTLCVKAHVGLAIYNTPTTLYAMERITSPAFGIDMDPSHIYRAGEEPAEALKQVLPKVKHVHIRDCLGRSQGPGVPLNQTCGRGDIDLFAYVRTLVEGGYQGPVCLEVIGAKDLSLAEVTSIAAESRGYLNACFKALGIVLPTAKVLQ